MENLLLLAPILLLCACTTMPSAQSEASPPLPQHLLLSRDSSGSAIFYQKVFKWDAPPLETPGTLGLISDDGLIGGIVSLPEDASTDQQAMWLVSMETDDLEGALAKVATNGGVVVHGPSTIKGGLRTAVVQDPQGGVFQVVQGEILEPDCWVWVELASETPSESASWYTKVFGVTQKESSGERILLSMDGTEFGAVSPTVFENSGSQWVPVLAVSDLPDHLSRVTSAKGEVLLASEADGVALILDPQGAPLLLQEAKL